MKSFDPLRSYRETQIKTATQGKLILMLYDGAIRYLDQAMESLAESHRKYDQVSNYLIRAQDIVTELMVSLDFERGGELARNLFRLYNYMSLRILDGNIKKQREPLEEVRKHLVDLRSSWASIADKAGFENLRGETSGVNIAG